MPIKTASGKWKWGNVERSSKKELVQTVYGIWKKNGSKGSFSDFLHGKHVNERRSEDKSEFFCDDCGKNMVEVPDDQYVMIDDKLWDYVCKRGKKLKHEDVLCRDCIEDRLGRKLTIDDLGKYKTAFINIEFKKLLKKQKKTNESSSDKFFKVKKNGKEIGKYGLSFYDDIKAVGIGDLEVYPEFRNKGYGTKIVKDIVDKYKGDYDKIYCFVDKDNEDAIRLYKRLGKVSDELNDNGQYEVEFYNKVNESSERIYAYHCTNVDPEKIKKEGWKVGDTGFTAYNMFKDLYKKYLPQVPVFISRIDVPVWSVKSKYCLKIDITDLDLYPDFGSLPDTGAYYDGDIEEFYWEGFIYGKELAKYVNSQPDMTLRAKNFSGEDSMKTLGTACVAGADLNKLKDRGIVEYVSKDGKKGY